MGERVLPLVYVRFYRRPLGSLGVDDARNKPDVDYMELGSELLHLFRLSQI